MTKSKRKSISRSRRKICKIDEQIDRCPGMDRFGLYKSIKLFGEKPFQRNIMGFIYALEIEVSNQLQAIVEGEDELFMFWQYVLHP
jgi:hypothetical protein